MSFIEKVSQYFPEVKGPEAKKLDFSTKLKWTLSILVLYFVLGVVPLYGLGANALQQFEFLSVILGASFGSLITLGIGPIVSASIILQLLNGSGIVKFDLTTAEGKKNFQSWQKLLSVFFILFESYVFVVAGGLSPAPGFSNSLLIFQLALGGFLIMLMDEVVSKWGFGSGLSLFIAAGVSQSLMIRLLSPLAQTGVLGFPFGSEAPTGALWALIYAITNQQPQDFVRELAAILSTILVFAMAVYFMAMKVEIPLSFGRVRGYGMRWPLNFFYTSNIPVILIAAVLANLQLAGRLLSQKGIEWLGTYSGNTPTSGVMFYLTRFNFIQDVILSKNFDPTYFLHAFIYISVFAFGSMLFSIFWVQTSGQDSKSLARQIMASGLQIPGFRRDVRVLERLLDRYIMPLTVMGGFTVGVLAAIADLTGALTSGTGLLLAVMIVYQLYQEIAKQHAMDMHPLMKKFVENN